MESRDPPARSEGRGYPFIRTSTSDAWNKVFDLSEFQLYKTDAELFSQNRSMMSISQLADRIDTIQVPRSISASTSWPSRSGSYFLLLEADSLLLASSAGARRAPDSLSSVSSWTRWRCRLSRIWPIRLTADSSRPSAGEISSARYYEASSTRPG
jgi:hypothetical protein